MRISKRRYTFQLVRPGTTPQRDEARAAAETVTLVLGGSALLPDYQPDLDDLVARLHVHIARLDRQLMPQWRRRIPALRTAVASARSLQRQMVPQDYVGSRIHLVRLAEAAQCLLAWVSCDERDLVPQVFGTPYRPDHFERQRRLALPVSGRWASLWESTPRGVRWVCHR